MNNEHLWLQVSRETLTLPRNQERVKSRQRKWKMSAFPFYFVMSLFVLDHFLQILCLKFNIIRGSNHGKFSSWLLPTMSLSFRYQHLSFLFDSCHLCCLFSSCCVNWQTGKQWRGGGGVNHVCKNLLFVSIIFLHLRNKKNVNALFIKCRAAV